MFPLLPVAVVPTAAIVVLVVAAFLADPIVVVLEFAAEVAAPVPWDHFLVPLIQSHFPPLLFQCLLHLQFPLQDLLLLIALFPNLLLHIFILHLAGLHLLFVHQPYFHPSFMLPLYPQAS